MPFASRLRHGLAVVLVSLAVPTGAYAQGGGAGDDQYSDPFAGEATPTATPRPAATATPAPPATAAATATPAPSSGATPAPPRLPYTGVDAWPLALAGAVLLGAGVTLRARLRD